MTAARGLFSSPCCLTDELIDEHEAVTPLKQFILPAGDTGAAHLHLARAICRRAERRVVTLVRRHETSVSEELIIYLNRLSDLLFVLTRRVNQIKGLADVEWVKPAQATPEISDGEAGGV